MSSLGRSPRPRPARSYDEAVARFERLHALDGPEIGPLGASRFYGHGARVPLAIVLLHGLTNAPEQWALFAARAHVRGANVIVPRFPGHGHIDRATRTIADVGADDLLATTDEAVDIARGAGDRVVLAGLSIGGSIALWTALRRADVDRAVAIVPLFGLARFGTLGNRAIAAALCAAPNAFVPWSPGGDRGQTPAYAYPRFPTHLLARTMHVGLDVVARARCGAVAGDVRFILNAREPAVDNGLAWSVASALTRTRPGRVAVDVIEGLPANHDIIDPHNANARIDIVYPRVSSAIFGRALGS